MNAHISTIPPTTAVHNMAIHLQETRQRATTHACISLRQDSPSTMDTCGLKGLVGAFYYSECCIAKGSTQTIESSQETFASRISTAKLRSPHANENHPILDAAGAEHMPARARLTSSTGAAQKTIGNESAEVLLFMRPSLRGGTPTMEIGGGGRTPGPPGSCWMGSPSPRWGRPLSKRHLASCFGSCPITSMPAKAPGFHCLGRSSSSVRS